MQLCWSKETRTGKEETFNLKFVVFKAHLIYCLASAKDNTNRSAERWEGVVSGIRRNRIVFHTPKAATVEFVSIKENDDGTGTSTPKSKTILVRAYKIQAEKKKFRTYKKKV